MEDPKIKHAYLIIAHSNEYVLHRLIESIDDERNDIYIHIDTKSSINSDLIKSIPRKSNIFVFKKYSIFWGHVISIETELFLYEFSSTRYNYSYYHLMSGVDLPLKSQDYIHDFFRKNQGKEFIGFSDAPIDMEKVNKIHLFRKSMRIQQTQYLKRGKRLLRNLFIQIQRIIGFDHTRENNLIFKFGANWSSLTHALVLDLIKNKDFFLRFYRYSCCGDEIYRHTFVYNSKYRDKVFDLNCELNSCQRLIDWKRGEPYTFTYQDLKELRSSPFLYARKFNENIDIKIIDVLLKSLKGQQ